ncbi:MAG: hypothetical protein ACOYN5_15985 [Bacteroidales bacterium]
MEDEEFKKNIEELFQLFKRLVEKHPMEEIPGMSRFQYEQLKMFLSSYESMKDQISFEMVHQVNEPMKQMLAMFIKQLRDQLGEEAIVIQPVEKLSEPNDAEKDLRIIDEMLTKPGLTEAEMDQLLDRRLAIQKTMGVSS